MSTDHKLGPCLALMSLLVLLVTLDACASPTARRQPTPTPATTSVPFPAPLSRLLGPAPKSCPAMAQLATFTMDASFGGGFASGEVFAGRSPVWNTVLSAGESLSVGSSAYPGIKIMWIVGPNYHQLATLSGHNLSTGEPAWFDMSGLGSTPSDPQTSAVLDPTTPNRGNTTNAGGGWQVVVAVGS